MLIAWSCFKPLWPSDTKPLPEENYIFKWKPHFRGGGGGGAAMSEIFGAANGFLPVITWTYVDSLLIKPFQIYTNKIWIGIQNIFQQYIL